MLRIHGKPIIKETKVNSLPLFSRASYGIIPQKRATVTFGDKIFVNENEKFS